MSKVLVTGGAGFIGSHLTDALVDRGDIVTILDDFSTGSRENIAHLEHNPSVTVFQGSVTDQAVVDDLVSRTDFIYHFAAVVGVDLVLKETIRVIDTNVQGTHAILQAAAEQRCPVLLASTSEVYGKSDRLPFREDDDTTVGPTSMSRWSYSVSKALDEFLALGYYRERNLPVVICRFFNTVGPRQTGRYGMVIPRFVRQALSGEPLSVFDDGQQSRCFLNVADAVRAVIALSDSPDAIGQVVNVGSDEEVTILDLARLVLRLTGNDESRVNFQRGVDARGPGFEDMRRRRPDTTRLRSLTGWSPVFRLEDTVQRVIEYERQRIA